MPDDEDSDNALLENENDDYGEEEDTDEENVEREFNFVGEFATLL